MATTVSPINGGKNWQIVLKFDFSCLETNSDSGLGFWITKNPIQILEQDYVF